MSGGACAAYRVQVVGNELSVAPTTTLAYLCAPVDAALGKLAKGEQVTVRGGDMVCLRNELRACGVWCESDSDLSWG